MKAGCHFNTFSFDEWMDEDSGLNQLIKEGKVQLTHQTLYEGGKRVWILINLPKELLGWDVWKLGYGWQPTECTVKVRDVVSGGELEKVPLSHSAAADTVEKLARDLDEIKLKTQDTAETILKVAAVGGVLYLFTMVVHPMVMDYRQSRKRST
jgi:hypothetical protein